MQPIYSMLEDFLDGQDNYVLLGSLSEFTLGLLENNEKGAEPIVTRACSLIEELLTFGDSSTADAVCIELFESLNESDRHFGELWRRFGPTSKKCWLQMHGPKARGNE